MATPDELRKELHEGLNRLEQNWAEFENEMLAKIEEAEKSLILEALAKVNARLAAIEEKLAEKDADKEDATVVDTKPKLKDRF